jgi:hypothetical protein
VLKFERKFRRLKVKLSRIKHWPRKNTHQNQNNQQVKHYQRHKPFITASVGVESKKIMSGPQKNINGRRFNKAISEGTRQPVAWRTMIITGIVGSLDQDTSCPD